MNVGSSDFDSNGTSLGSQNGSTLGQISIGTVTGAEAAVGVVDAAIQQVSSSAAKLGAISNRLDHVVNNLQETIVNTSASKSRILDADFAVESANLAKQQVLQQAATAMLAQANAQPQSVLALLGA
jgi:flagellin